MKRIIRSIALSLLALVLIVVPCLAAFSATIQITGTTTAYTMTGFITDMDNEFLADNNYTTSTALDTRIERAGAAIPHMIVDDKTLFATGITAGGVTNVSYVTGASALPNFNILTGYNGFITIADVAALEIDDEFTIEIEDCYITTAVAAGCDIVSKGTDFSIFTGDVAGEVTAAIPISETYNPDAHVEVDSVDGNCQELQLAGVTWAAIHDPLASTGATDAANWMYARWRCDAVAAKWDVLERAFVLFDTSPIPNGATITSATIQVFGTNKADDKPWGDLTVNVFSSNPAIDTAIGVADYDQVGTTPFATAITFAAFDAAGWNTFTLNANGIAAIDDTGVSMFSIREATYDAPDVAPAWGGGNQATFTMNTADSGNAPILTVFYAIEVTAINVASGVHDIDVTADGVDLEISIDSAVAGDYYDTVALGGAAVVDNGDDWILMDNSTTDFMPYMSYYKHTTAIGGVSLKAWYQPNDIIVNATYDGTETAGGSMVTVTDNTMTDPPGYWVGALVTITDAGAAAPEGETSICTVFAAGGVITVAPAFSVNVDIGDEFTIEFGTLVDRQGGDEPARLTWGVNPADLSYTIGSLVSDDVVIAATVVVSPDVLQVGGVTSAWDAMAAPVNDFSAIVASVATGANVAPVVVWEVIGMVFVIGTFLIIYAVIKDTKPAVIMACFVMLLFAVAGVFPKWVIFLAVVIVMSQMFQRQTA